MKLVTSPIDFIDMATTNEMVAMIIEDGNVPRTIKEIKEKYDLDFPFRVRKVANTGAPNEKLPVGRVVDVFGFKSLVSPQGIPFVGVMPPIQIDEDAFHAVDATRFPVFVLA